MIWIILNIHSTRWENFHQVFVGHWLHENGRYRNAYWSLRQSFSGRQGLRTSSICFRTLSFAGFIDDILTIASGSTGCSSHNKVTIERPFMSFIHYKNSYTKYWNKKIESTSVPIQFELKEITRRNAIGIGIR